MTRPKLKTGTPNGKIKRHARSHFRCNDPTKERIEAKSTAAVRFGKVVHARLVLSAQSRRRCDDTGECSLNQFARRRQWAS
jgi:hypothetical protein